MDYNRQTIYVFQLSNIKCSSCAKKINDASKSVDGVIHAVVDILQEKLYLTLESSDIIKDVQESLASLPYKLIGKPYSLSKQNKSRNLKIKLKNGTNPISVDTPGIKNITNNFMTSKQFQLIQIQYQPQIIKGWQIINLFQQSKCSFTILNQIIQNMDNSQPQTNNKKTVIISTIIVTFFIIFDIIIPLFSQSKRIILFPKQFNYFSLYLISNIIATIISLQLYGFSTYKLALFSYIQKRQLSMVTLIALGSFSSLCLSIFQLIVGILKQNNKHDVIMQVSMSLMTTSLILCIVNIGKYFQNNAKKKIKSITDKIFPKKELFANMEINFIQIKDKNLNQKKKGRCNVQAIQKGDIVILQPGRLLLDVIVLDGQITAIDSIMTGNDQPHKFDKGQRIQSGSIVISGNAKCQVQNIFQNCTLLKIGNQIIMQKIRDLTGVEIMCQKIADKFVKIVILIALLDVIIWIILIVTNSVQMDQCKTCFVVEKGIGILVASCPCALGLAIPSVVSISLNIATKHGILIRSNKLFQLYKTIKIVAFDKTGTLFTSVKEIQHFNIISKQYEQEELWQIIALIQKQFIHPLASLLYKVGMKKSNIHTSKQKYILAQKPKLGDKGIEGKVLQRISKKVHNVLIGNKYLLQQNLIQVPNYQNFEGYTQLFLVLDQKCCMVYFNNQRCLLNTHSNLRPEAKFVVEQLTKDNKQVHIISGDSKQSVYKLAQKLNIKYIHPQFTAPQKKIWVEQIKSKQGVMMIGDGLNDIMCLQSATIGFSINAKSELNLKAASVIAIGQNLQKILTFFKLMKKSDLHVKLNLLWAFAYNIIMLPIVAGAFYNYNIQISSYWASFAMSSSSLMVLLNSHLLLFYSFEYNSKIDEKQNVSDLLLQSSIITNQRQPLTQ